MDDAKVLIAFAAGIAVGVAAAVYGPKTMCVTKKKLHDGLEDAREYVDSAGKYVKKATDRYGRQMENVVHDARETVHDVVDRASGAVKTLSNMVA